VFCCTHGENNWMLHRVCCLFEALIYAKSEIGSRCYTCCIFSFTLYSKANSLAMSVRQWDLLVLANELSKCVDLFGSHTGKPVREPIKQPTCRHWFCWCNRYLRTKSENIWCGCTGGDDKRQKALPTHFHIQQSVLPALSEKAVYEHLGLPTGYHVTQSANKSLKDKLQNKNDWFHDKSWMP